MQSADTTAATTPLLAGAGGRLQQRSMSASPLINPSRAREAPAFCSLAARADSAHPREPQRMTIQNRQLSGFSPACGTRARLPRAPSQLACLRVFRLPSGSRSGHLTESQPPAWSVAPAPASGSAPPGSSRAIACGVLLAWFWLSPGRRPAPVLNFKMV